MADAGLDYASLLGGGLFGPDGQVDPAAFQSGRANAGLLGMAAALMQAGGASRLPVTTGSALGAGLSGYQQAQQAYLKDALSAAQARYIGANTTGKGIENQLNLLNLHGWQGLQSGTSPALAPTPKIGAAAMAPIAFNGDAASDSGSISDPRGLIPYISQGATARGIDPAVAVRVAGSEGLANPVGDGGKSGGAFQLHVTPDGAGGHVGDLFRRDTGLDPLDPNNEKATIDYALDHAAKNGWGEWNGAKRIGVTGMMGIGAANAGASGTAPAASAGGDTPAPVMVNELNDPATAAAINAAPASGAPIPLDGAAVPSLDARKVPSDPLYKAFQLYQKAGGQDLWDAYAGRNAPMVPAPQAAAGSTGTNTPPPQFQLAEGDSIGVGLRSQGMLKGNPVGGRNPQAVLDNIGANLQANPDYYRGQRVILSSGVMNGPDGLALVPQQIAAIRKAGGNVVLAGADQGKFANLNPQLAQIAQGAGVPFAGPLPTNDVHPSPQGYRQYLGGAQGLAAAPVTGAAPTMPRTASPAASGGAAPAFSVPTLIQQYNAFRTFPAGQAQATAIMGLLQKMAPEGFQLNSDGSATLRPGIAQGQGEIEGAKESNKRAAAFPYDIATENNKQTQQRVTESMKPEKIDPTQTMVYPPGSPGALAYQNGSPGAAGQSPSNAQISPDGSVRVMGGNPTNSQIDETQKDFLKLKDEATAAREGLYKAQLLRQQLHAIGTSGPMTEHLGDLGAFAQQMGVPEETVQKYLGVRPASVEAADKLSQDLLGEVLKQTFPQRITNADITAWKNTVPRGTMLQDAYDLLLDKTVNPKFERSVARYGAVAGLPATDPQLHTYTQALESFDKVNPMDSFVRTYAYGPNGHRLMLDRGQWVDETTRRPAQ